MAPDYLSLPALEDLLATETIGKPRGWRNEVWETIDSTNNRAIQLAAEGAPEGLIVAARQQTAGRGRLGRTWVSPPDNGVYVSFLLRPDIPASLLPLMSLAAGIASARAIQAISGFKAGLKWVNDIVWSGRKLGGILTEMPPRDKTAGARALIVGIGINRRFDLSDLPEELQSTATALETVTGNPVNANMLVARLAEELERTYALLRRGERTQILDEWTSFSCTIGQQICATSGNTTYEGRALGLAADGGLRLATDDGHEIVLHAGEVSIRNRDGSYSS